MHVNAAKSVHIGLMLVCQCEVWWPDFPRRSDTKQQDTWASCHMLRQGRERTYLLQERRFTRQKVIISANMYKLRYKWSISYYQLQDLWFVLQQLNGHKWTTLNGHKWTTSFNLDFNGPVCNCIMFDFHQLAGSQLRAAHDGSYFSLTSKEGTAVMQQAWPDMASIGQPFSFFGRHGQLWSALVKVRKIKKIVWIQDDPRHQHHPTATQKSGVWNQPWGSSQGRKHRNGAARPGVLGDGQGQGLGMVWRSDYACSTVGMMWLWNVMDMDVIWFLVTSGVILNWSMFKLHHYDASWFINISMWLLEKWKRITNCRGKTCSNSSALEP